jgi:hypothetical protein
MCIKYMKHELACYGLGVTTLVINRYRSVNLTGYLVFDAKLNLIWMPLPKFCDCTLLPKLSFSIFQLFSLILGRRLYLFRPTPNPYKLHYFKVALKGAFLRCPDPK